MITLPHHVEFLSDAGSTRRANSSSAKSHAARNASAAKRSRSAQRFDDAPPHLGLPGNVAAWTLRCDGETPP